ncbi:hypothetical protein OFY05_12585 [Pseudocitrobacter faecalis]|nr:hypothetical protein OFY05_12585 [Pseudocitrobacter faecalis]
MNLKKGFTLKIIVLLKISETVRCEMSKEKQLPGVQESERALNFEAACRNGRLILLLLVVLLAIGGLFFQRLFESNDKGIF